MLRKRRGIIPGCCLLDMKTWRNCERNTDMTIIAYIFPAVFWPAKEMDKLVKTLISLPPWCLLGQIPALVYRSSVFVGLRHICSPLPSLLFVFHTAGLTLQLMHTLMLFSDTFHCVDKIQHSNQWRRENHEFHNTFNSLPSKHQPASCKPTLSLTHCICSARYLSRYMPLLAIIAVFLFVSCYSFITLLVDFSPYPRALTLSRLMTVHNGATHGSANDGLNLCQLSFCLRLLFHVSLSRLRPFLLSMSLSHTEFKTYI